MPVALAPFASPLYMLAKPVGSACNLVCDYCYYLEKQQLHPGRQDMSDEMLEQFTREYIQAQTMPQVLFAWHGGEPLLRKREFYKKAIRLQRKYAGPSRQVDNSLQTNGTLLDDAWCEFFKEHNFLIGISLDGPEHCHNHFRRYASGHGSFAGAMRGIECLLKHGVDFNILSVVNSYNVQFPEEVYRFFKSTGAQFVQFTPVVERFADSEAGKVRLASAGNRLSELTPWSVKPLDFGNFLCRVFDEWVTNDVATFFVTLFDSLLANRMGVPPGHCHWAPTCGHAGAIEYNGDVYACDHYVFDEYRLGNLATESLVSMMYSPRQLRFGREKQSLLPGYCLECPWLNLCNGECPKNRFALTPDGETGLNYLCPGLRLFFTHLHPYLEFMAHELTNKRPPANVMAWARQQRLKS